MMKTKYILIFCLFFFILVGCSQNIEITKENDFYLTYEKVFNTLVDNGLKLTKNKNLENNVFKLYNTNPNILTMENNEILLVYIFNDMREREEAESELSSQRKNFIGLFDDEIVIIETLKAKNVLLVVPFSKNYLYATNSSYQSVINNLRTIVFESLNEGKEILFTGSSEYWEGEILTKSYSHSVLDEDGILIDWDDYGQGSGELHYKGNVDNIYTSVNYKIEGYNGSLSSEVTALKSKEIYKNIKIGISSAAKDDTKYTITINWNDKVETFEFIAK